MPGGPDSGLDDVTYARFIAAKFESASVGRIPGRNLADPLRFEARARFVEAAGMAPWLAWRAREVASVYSSLADAARISAPGAILAVVTPGLDFGPAGDEARRGRPRRPQPWASLARPWGSTSRSGLPAKQPR